jgi:DNA end-binding protein Ku
MAVRALWEGVITFQRMRVPVRLYSAVADRDVHFHLLHNKDHVRLQQRMVNPRTGEVIDRSDLRKAFPVDETTYVLITDEEVDALATASSRTIQVTRFVPTESISLEWYDRPYFLGPADDHAQEFHALADALARQERCGNVQWVMRKREYAGALCSKSGHLLLITLHHAGEVVPITELERPPGRDLSAEENALAEELIESLADEFDPAQFHEEYQEQVRKLVEAKRRGKKAPARRRAKPRAEPKSLADALRRSVRRVHG